MNSTPGSIHDPTPVDHRPDGVKVDVHAVEETLDLALSEVRRTEEELHAAEEVLNRLQGELAHRLSEAEHLMTQASDAYERERERLDQELALIQKRASDLGEARAHHTEGVPDEPVTAEAPADEPVTAEAPADEPVTAQAPADADGAAPGQPDEPPASAADQDARPSSADLDGHVDQKEDAYEDHWYQVLRQGLHASGIDFPHASAVEP